MLEPATRTLFFEMLRPPEGYGLDEAIATTFTLDLITLLTAPLAFTTFECSDESGKPTTDPVVLLEALRRNADKMTVFSQAGRTAAPAQQGILYSYLEPMVTEVTAPLGGVFHPKLWILRFAAEGLPAIVRLVVLSRNLTGDRCWDVSLVLDGEVADRKVGFSAHAELCDFIKALPGLALRTVPPAVVERANRLAEDVRRAAFALPEGFDQYEFAPLGLKKRRRLPFDDRRKRMLVVSPFITQGFLDDLTDGTTGHILVSRLEELAKLPKDAFAPFERIYVLNERTTLTDEADEAALPDSILTGLHAKLYLIDKGWDSTLYIGSPNATGPAFSRNVEFLVGLTGKRSQVGVDQLLQSEEGEASFLDLLTPYEPSDSPQDTDQINEELERQLDQFRLLIAMTGLRVAVETRSDGHILRLAGAEGIVIPQGISAAVWPITLPEPANSIPLGQTDKAFLFGPLPLAAVTSFFCIAARATAAGTSLEARFTLNLPLDNAPAGRREAIMGALLDDPEKFLRFLQFLLGDLDELGPLPTATTKSADTTFGSWGPGSFSLFEALLRALKDDPKRLDYVASVVTELTSDQNHADRLPVGFLPIWEPIWIARKSVRT